VPLLTSGHNSYLDITLTLGLPGLALVIGWIVVSPLLDLSRIPRGRDEYALTLLFVRIWLFGITSTSFESVFLQRDDPVWFLLLMAIFGLRYLATQRVIA
jgi:O-antigen ligase